MTIKRSASPLQSTTGIWSERDSRLELSLSWQRI